MTDGFWYLGSPYTNFPDGHATAYDLACRAAASLIRAGFVIFSPIAHSHSLVAHGLDGTDPDLWKRQDAPLVAAAKGMIVVMIPGWAESAGVQHEIAEFRCAGKPVLYYEMDLRGNEGIIHESR